MNFNLIAIIVLGFAAFRITRFLVIDSLLDGSRTRFHVFLSNRQGKLKFFSEKLLDLTSCTWCTGAWITLLLYSLYIWHNPIDFTRFDWISVFAVAGIQGLLHAWEPDSE